MKEELLQDLCHQASSLGVVSISNYNCPGQLVVAGEKGCGKCQRISFRK